MFSQVADAIYNLGRIWYLSAKYTKAEEILNQALKVDPMFHNARIVIASIYLKRGDRKKAHELLMYVLKHDPENENAKANLLKIYKREVQDVRSQRD